MNLIESTFAAGTTVSIPASFSCPLCGRECAVRGFSTHLRACLRKHGLSQDEYEKAYSTYLYGPVHRFAAKWFSLARFSIHRFGLMDYGDRYWCHIDARKPQPWYSTQWGRKPETLPLVRFKDGAPLLTKSFLQFKKHLEGALTLGIWPDMHNCFTVIDLDDEQAQKRVDLQKRLIDLHLSFHVVFSGRKGFHFWIFWDRCISNSRLIQIHEFLCADIPSDRNIWPFKPSLIKLPLGLHRESSRLACFVDHSAHPIPLDQQLSYFLDVQDNEPPKAKAMPRRKRRRKSKHRPAQPIHHRERSARSVSGKTVEWQLSSADCLRIIRERCVPDDCCRERLLFRLAAFLKVEGHGLADCQRILRQWSHEVSARSWRELGYDVDRQVRAVFERGVYSLSSQLPELSEQQKRIIGSVLYDLLHTPHASKKRHKSHQKRALETMTRIATYLTRLIIGHGGSCFTSFESIAKRTSVNPKRVQKWLPLMCGEPWISSVREWPGVNVDRPEYVGRMFVRVERAHHLAQKAQAYMLTVGLAEALGLSVMAARRDEDDEVWCLRGAHLDLSDGSPDFEPDAPTA